MDVKIYTYYELYCWDNDRTYLKTTIYKSSHKTWWKSEWVKECGD